MERNRPDYITYRLDAIKDNAMAASILASTLANLKNDAEGLNDEDAKEYPALAKIKSGCNDYCFLRAIEVLANEIENNLTPVIGYINKLEQRETRNESRPPTMGAA